MILLLTWILVAQNLPDAGTITNVVAGGSTAVLLFATLVFGWFYDKKDKEWAARDAAWRLLIEKRDTDWKEEREETDRKWRKAMSKQARECHLVSREANMAMLEVARALNFSTYMVEHQGRKPNKGDSVMLRDEQLQEKLRNVSENYQKELKQSEQEDQEDSNPDHKH